MAVDPFPCGDGGVSGCVGLLDALVGFWRLDDPAGAAVVRDFSGQANDGKLIGLDPDAAWVADGPEGRALAPQGKAYVLVPQSNSINMVTMAVTVAAWIYIDGSITEYATAISRQIGTSYGQHYHLSINSSMAPTLFLTTPTSGQVYISNGAVTVAPKTWVHIAGTYDGITGRLFVNGVQVASSPVAGPFAVETNPVILSGNGNAAGPDYTERIPGRLDDVMLYHRALSPGEIVRLKQGALIGWGGAANRDAATDASRPDAH
ncbi:MAG TPA: LamG domain-containing protein [Polyangia bacterium]|nr:LamG domain-containing protein [Polyangia bacterium]